MARRKRYDDESMRNSGSVGYSKQALEALERGTYGKTTGRQAQYRTSQEQTQPAKKVPALEGITRSSDWESSFSRNKSHVNTDRARRNYADRINYSPLGQETPKLSNDENYVVKRDRYDKLMKDSRLSNDIKTLAEINYKNANQDATVSQEWADEYGAKKITGGFTKSQYLNTLSRRYGLTPKELNDMALTFHSDAYKKETEDYGKKLEDIGQKHEVLGSVGSLVGTLGSGVEGAYNTAIGGLTGDDRYLSNIFSTTKKSPREGVKKNIKSNAGKTVYDIGMGIGDMAAGAAAGSAPVILAGNTANEAMQSAMNRGSSVRKSALYGTGAGALDFVTNKIGLDKAKSLAVDSIKSTGIKKFLTQNAIAGLGEAGENVLQDIGQSFIDALVNGKNSELSQSYNNKVANGMSESDAFKETAKEYASQLGMSAGLGFGMGSAMQAGATAIPKVPELVRNYKNKNQNLGVMDDSVRNFIANGLNGRDSINIEGNDYSIDRTNNSLVDSNGKEVPIIDPTVFDTSKRGTPEQTKRQFAAQLTKYIKDNYVGKTFTVKDNGRNIGFIGESADEFAGSNSSFRKNNEKMGLKANIAPRLQSVIENALFNHHEDNTKSYTPMKGRGMDKYDITIAYPTKDGIELYDAVMNVGLHQDGNDYFFDILDIEPKKKADTQLLSNDSVTDISRPSFDNTVPPIDENVNMKPSYTGDDIANRYVETMREAYGDKYFDDEDYARIFNEIKEDIANGEDLTRHIETLEEAEEDTSVAGTAAHLRNLINDLIAIQNGEAPQADIEPPIVKPEEITPVDVNNVPPKPPINLTQEANGDVRESGTSRHIRAEDTAMKYDVPEELAADFTKDPQMYKQLKNADTKALSDAIYDSGDEPVTINGKVYEGNPEAKFRVLLSEKNPASLPLGDKIAKDYSAQGNHDMAAQIYRDMGRSLTEAGQFTQASAISMMKNDPLSALAYMEKEIDALNKAGADKYGKKWNNFELTDAEREMFNNIAPGDEKAIKAAYDKVGERIEREYPASAWEKVLEFRRVAMLLNTRTIVRNTLANPPTAGLRYISDRIEGVGQAVAHLINPDFEVTQSITGSNVKTRKLASEIFKSDKVQNLLKEVPGKLSEVPKVGDYAKSKQVFKGGIVSDFINKLTDNGIEKLNAKLGKKGAKSALELARNTAYSALEVTDSPFVRENFISRLGSYMKAKGIDNVKDVPDEAINIALEEALKATYKDDSWLVQGIRKAKGSMESIGNGIMPGVRLGDMASQALIPYVQAPGNIGARIIDYSPIGGTRGIANIINGATKNDTKAIAKGIEEFSKGATGTMMAALGMALYRSGILTGTYSDDKDQKAFEKKNGFREFAIKYQSPFDGKTKYDTIDWAQPFVDTLMPGVLLAQAIDNSDGYDSDILRYFGIEDSSLGKGLGIAGDTIGKNINYFFSATPLKNLGELLQSKGYGDVDIASNLRENIVEDFASALVPAGINALAKSVDTTQRQTFNPDNTFATFINSNIAKIPGLSKTLPVKYDTWGQPMTNGENMGEAAYKKMLYPGEHTTDTNDAIDNEINRLFDATQNKGVFPQVAPYSVDGVKLTDKEYSKYQQTMGQRNRQMVENLVNSPAYQSLDDETRADIVDNLFKASKAIADYEIKGKEYTNTYKKIGELYASGGVDAVVNNYLSKDIAKSAGLSTSSKAAKEIEQAVQSGNIQAAQQMATEASAAKEAAANAGMVKDDGSVNTEHYQKVMARAGSQSSRLQNDLPALKGMGLPDSADYVYANAINVNPNITVPEFTQTYNEIDTDKSNKLTQKEMLAYINKYQFSNDPNEDLQMATDLYRTYQDGTWKKQLYLKKDGTYGLK